MSKKVQTCIGEVTINTPRDRDGTFDPQVVKKREKILADSLADRIIGLYAIGKSTRETAICSKNSSVTASPLRLSAA